MISRKRPNLANITELLIRQEVLLAKWLTHQTFIIMAYITYIQSIKLIKIILLNLIYFHRYLLIYIIRTCLIRNSVD